MKTSKENASFKGLFKWRSEIAFIAILVVAALHFVFQFSFIRSENIENSRIIESPVEVNELPVKIERSQEQTSEIKTTEFRTEKADDAKPAKSVITVKQRRTEITPAKLLPKKRIPVESRVARLRRAERILTGV